MYYQKRANKFGAKKTVWNGIQYDSKLEAGYAHDLDLLKKAGQVKDIQRQVRFSLDVNKIHIANYIADFVVTLPNGQKQVHETKGFSTDVFRMKWKLMEALYGDEYDLLLIKQ